MSSNLSASDHLLVPMNIQAAVVNHASSNNFWSVGKMDYTNLANFDSSSAELFPETTAEELKQGVHLLWELPAAFRQGIHNPNSNEPPKYPYAPNRWLVARFWPDATKSGRKCKAWIINSDDSTNGTSPFVNPAAKVGDSPETKFGKGENPYAIGSSMDIASWVETDETAQLFLQALGPGSVTYSAYSPNVENVFSFVDDGSDGNGTPLVSDASYSISKASGSTIVISSAHPTPLETLFATGSKMIISRQGDFQGIFTVASSTPSHQDDTLTVTINETLDSGTDWTSGAAYLIDNTCTLVSATSDSFTIEYTGADPSSQFPVNGMFYVTGSDGNDGSYQVLRTTLDTAAHTFKITVAGSTGIRKPGSISGSISTQNVQHFVKFDYLVVGWYSNPEGDPLYNTSDLPSWAEQLSALKWTTNIGPYPVSSVHTNKHNSTSELWVKGCGNLSSQFAASTSITVVGSDNSTTTYTLGSGADKPVYNKATQTMVLSLTTEASAPNPGEHFYVVPGSISEISFPQNSLIHGQLNSVIWQNSGSPQRANSTQNEVNENVTVAVGNSSIEALSASFVNEQLSDMGTTSLTGAKSYPGSMSSANSPVAITVGEDLTKSWFPVGSSIVITDSNLKNLGSFHISGTLFVEGNPASDSTLNLYLDDTSLLSDQTFPLSSLKVTPTYLDADMMDAFQTNQLALLDQPGGRTKLELALEKENFRPEKGGTTWKLEAISGKPIFEFAIASAITGADPGFTLDMTGYSSATQTGLNNLFAQGAKFEVTGTAGSAAGTYKVASSSSSGNTFTIVTTTAPTNTELGPTNTLKIAASTDVLPISFNIKKLSGNTILEFEINSEVDLTPRFPVGSTFTVTGGSGSIAGTYTVGSPAPSYSDQTLTLTTTTALDTTKTFSSANKIELDNPADATKRAQWLADLNIIQNNLDREMRVLQSLQSECYALWWQYNYIPLHNTEQNYSQDEINQMALMLGAKELQVVDQMATVKSWETQISTQISSLDVDTSLITTELRPQLNAYWQLKATSKPRFYQAKDPELLISGLDSSFDIANAAAPNTALFCRFSDQLISQLTYSGSNTIKATEVPNFSIPAITHPVLPSAKVTALNTLFSGLSYEALFLNVGSADLLASVNSGTSADIALAIEQQKGFGNTAGTAVVPESLAIQQWQQAWMPLLLEWRVNWLSSQASSVGNGGQSYDNWYFDQKAWEFDGKQYHFNQSFPAETHSFTSDAAQKQLTLQPADQRSYLSSKIQDNQLIIKGSDDQYGIESSNYSENKLTITLSGTDDISLSPIDMSFLFTVSREGYPLLSESTASSLIIQVSPEQYSRFRANSLNVLVYNDPDDITNYEIQSQTYDIQSQQLTLSTYTAGSNSISGTLYLVVTYTPASVLEGQTFLTPEATFNFRSRLEQYIGSHQGTETADHLQDVEHIMDIIAGQHFDIAEAKQSGNAFVVNSEINLDHLFPEGSTCYVSQSNLNDGAYTVASTPTISQGQVTITVEEPVQNTPIGILTPAPHQWDLLSQTLTGFTDQLIMRSQKANVSPGGAPMIKSPASAPDNSTKPPLTSYTDGGLRNSSTFVVGNVDTDISVKYQQGDEFTLEDKSTGTTVNLMCDTNAEYSASAKTLTLYATPGNGRNDQPLPPHFSTEYTDYYLKLGGDGPAPTPAITAADFANAPWYALSTGSGANNTLSFASAADLSHLFPVGQHCYFANAVANPAYQTTALKITTVAYSSGSMSVTVAESLGSNLTGFIGPDLSALIGGHHLGYPDIGEATASGSSAAAYYHPIRGGFFEFNELRIVDRFGQAVDLLFANGNYSTGMSDAAKTFRPIKSRALTLGPDDMMPNPHHRLSKLTPSMVTPARLDFGFVDGSGGANDKIDIDLLADPRPVCGWILPNHLDGGISVYDSEGILLGELLLSIIPDQSAEIIWYPPPPKTAPVQGSKPWKKLSELSATDIPNQYLLNMLQGLDDANQVDSAQAFQNFLQAIDETLWAVDDASTQSDQHLALLLGRPLALVRGKLRLNLYGHANYNQNPSDFTENDLFESWTPTKASGSSNAFVTITNSAATSDEITSLIKRFKWNRTLSISGRTANAGVYHIIDAVQVPGHSNSVQVNLLEDLITNDLGGSLTLNPPSDDTTSLEWPLKLGLANLYDDGLIGYFKDGEGFNQLNCVHKPVDMPDAGYLKAIGGNDQNFLSLKYNAEVSHGAAQSNVPAATPEAGATFITMLLDPRAAVHAANGMLPTKSVQLPSEFTKKAMRNMKVTFRVGPLLTNPKKIQMPLPVTQEGDWSWLEVKSSGERQKESVTNAGQTAELPARPLTLRDGWLALTNFETGEESL
tara:strand:- start:40294 stop:47295 length:7002 start_codon:yes stop_codon:yes gene_type:complete